MKFQGTSATTNPYYIYFPISTKEYNKNEIFLYDGYKYGIIQPKKKKNIFFCVSVKVYKNKNFVT